MKIVAQNRRARFDFEITDTLEAGIILTGQEVKSCRAGHVSLAGSYVSMLGGKPVIKQMKIMPYAYASGLENYDPGRDRPLLLTARQVASLHRSTEEKGITVIPLEVKADRYIKVVLGLARGRKKHDKRARIKERDLGKRMRRGEEN